MVTKTRAWWAVRACTLGALLLTTSACVRQGRALDPSADSFWLTATGFDEREDWPSTVFHMGPGEIGGAPRITFLLDDAPRILLLPAEGEGWGVHLTDEDGEEACELQVWLNGAVRERRPMSGIPSVDGLIPARRLSGLEIHTGPDGPIRDPGDCGVLLLWSEDVAGPGQRPFRGRVVGRIRGNLADTVEAVRLEPDGQRIRPDRLGRYELAGVVPGVYQVVFMTAAGPLYRRMARVYAYSDTRVDIDVSREGG